MLGKEEVAELHVKIAVETNEVVDMSDRLDMEAVEVLKVK